MNVKDIVEDSPQRTNDTMNDLNKMHSKWKSRQFHFDHQDDSLEQRDEIVASSRCDAIGSASREHASDPNHPIERLVKSSLSSKKQRQGKSASRKQSCESKKSKCTLERHDTSQGPHRQKNPEKASNDTVASKPWKAKQADEYLKRMIQKLQVQNDSGEIDCANIREKRKGDKRRKLLSLLNEIKRKMNQETDRNINSVRACKPGDPSISIDLLSKDKQSKEKLALPAQDDNPSSTAPFKSSALSNATTSNEESKMETKMTPNSFNPTQGSSRTVSIQAEKETVNNNNSSLAPKATESNGIPQEIVIKMQKLLSSQRHIDRGPRILGRIAARRLRKASVLGAIPENQSVSFNESYSVSNTEITDERMRLDKKQHETMVDGVVDLVIDVFRCGLIGDFSSSSTELGDPVRHHSNRSRQICDL